MLVTRAGSEFDSIEDLRGAVVGFSDPASTSGYIVPSVVFTEKVLDGESLNSYFGQAVFTGSHDATILGVTEGRIDAGFTWDGGIERLIIRGEIDADDLNVLWTSDPIPLDPYSYRTTLAPEIRKNIKKAFLTFHEQPESEEFFEAIKATVRGNV